MTEAEYIAATNLTKLRQVYRTLIDLLECPQIAEDDLKEVLIPIAGWIEATEEIVLKEIGGTAKADDSGDFHATLPRPK